MGDCAPNSLWALFDTSPLQRPTTLSESLLILKLPTWSRCQGSRSALANLATGVDLANEVTHFWSSQQGSQPMVLRESGSHAPGAAAPCCDPECPSEELCL